MQTRNTVAGIVLLSAGALAGSWYSSVQRDGQPAASAARASPGPQAASTLENRVASLEAALAMERQARQVLEDELVVLSRQFTPKTDGSVDLPGSGGETTSLPGDGTSAGGRSRRGRDDDLQVRHQRLVSAGFSSSEAARILRREAEIQMETLQARYEARRNGERLRYGDSDDILRSEMGDDIYERYLAATGRPTSVTVSTVYEGSPALVAGLRPGDQILRYDGARIFSMNEISSMTLEGSAGEMITMDILRDGMPMQLSIPRGPLGVVGGRRMRR